MICKKAMSNETEMIELEEIVGEFLFHHIPKGFHFEEIARSNWGKKSQVTNS